MSRFTPHLFMIWSLFPEILKDEGLEVVKRGNIHIGQSLVGRCLIRILHHSLSLSHFSSFPSSFGSSVWVFLLVPSNPGGGPSTSMPSAPSGKVSLSWFCFGFVLCVLGDAWRRLWSCSVSSVPVPPFFLRVAEVLFGEAELPAKRKGRRGGHCGSWPSSSVEIFCCAPGWGFRGPLPQSVEGPALSLGKRALLQPVLFFCVLLCLGSSSLLASKRRLSFLRLCSSSSDFNFQPIFCRLAGSPSLYARP